MTADEATRAVIEALNSLQLPYMLVGSLSSNYYGIVRATQDADFVIEHQQESLSKLKQQLPAALRFDPQIGFEMVTGTKRNHIQLINSEFLIELFRLSDDPHDQERFRRRRQATILGVPTWLPTVEDVIVTKLRWSQIGARQKDIDDVRNVIAVQNEHIDWTYCNSWCQKHGTAELLRSIRESIPR